MLGYILSPGSLPRNLTFANLFSGRSEVRNHTIARVFKELGLIEQWGSGISRIIQSCEKAGLATPEITEENDFIDIKLFRVIPNEVKAKDKTSFVDDSRTITDNAGRLRENHEGIRENRGRL
ncbi:MAG: ATP-binding protein [Candidatus Cloacimonadales bacterium]